jgi:hypothetical protein
VLSSAAPYGDDFCAGPAAPGTFTGKIVACKRGAGIARVTKGFNVLQGGAAGMILYNPTLADVETDNHWLPTVHLADGTQFSAFAAAHASFTGQFTAGTKVTGTGDVMAAFSSRGPGGRFIKPDVTAPGVEILAGNTPTPESAELGPPGQYFQAIAGTSMSSPHTAGSAILLKALHPTWTPGQIKSALMTTANTNVVKEDLTTPADPFDFGSGRLTLGPAGNPGLTFDETAENMALLGNDPVHAVDLNLPSVNAPVMPGRLTTTRVAVNVTNRSQTYSVSTSAPAGTSISVSPNHFTVAAGGSVALKITIRSTAPTAQYFGQVKLDPARAGLPTLHLPVAFVPQQGSVNLTSACAPASIKLFTTSTCTVTATNNSAFDTTVDLRTESTPALPIVSATGATVVNPLLAKKDGVALGGNHPGVPSIAPGVSPGGYIPLSLFGVAPVAIGDEQIVNFNVPDFIYTGAHFTRIGIDSNGYIVVGGGTAQDNLCCGQPPIPNTNRPNNILAPYWTDLDGTSDQGIRVATLTDGVHTWIVVEWQVDLFGTNTNKHFQVWIGINGTEDISFTYDPAALPGASPYDLRVGVENIDGTGGQEFTGALSQDLVVTSTPPTAGESVSYSVNVFGLLVGTSTVTSSMTTPVVPGTTVVRSDVQVTRH